jgi:menaquinone-dependent protoporphyrinogen IX oxidase
VTAVSDDMMLHCLVVYYSRSGTTRAAARAIADGLHCSVEEIVALRRRPGVLGYLQATLDSARRRGAAVAPDLHNPGTFDLVIVGSPVWDLSVSSPVRTYLARHRGHFRGVAFFCTQRTGGAPRAFRQMAQLAGRRPVALLALEAGDVKRGRYPAMGRFLDQARNAVGVASGA